jgi:hypothetical protein
VEFSHNANAYVVKWNKITIVENAGEKNNDA